MTLSLKEREQYAKTARRLEWGTAGYPLTVFRQVHLTTAPSTIPEFTKQWGSPWQWEFDRFRKDHRALVNEYRKEGYSVEFCGVVSLTPKSGLVHGHFIWRISGGYFLCPLDETKTTGRTDLRRRWRRIHGAWNVALAPVRSGSELRGYVLKHVPHGLIGERGLVLSSRYWLPGWQKENERNVVGLLTHGKGKPGMDKERWRAYNRMMLRILSGETVTFGHEGWELEVRGLHTWVIAAPGEGESGE